MKSFSLSKALLSSSALIAISVSPAFAQDGGVDQTPAAAEDQQPAERIVVTGTRIRQSTITSPVSMDVLSVDDARSAGVADISGLLPCSSPAAGSSLPWAAAPPPAQRAPPTSGASAWRRPWFALESG